MPNLSMNTIAIVAKTALDRQERNMELELLTPYELKTMDDDQIMAHTIKIKSMYNNQAVSPYQLTENQEIIAYLMQIFLYMASKCESEYALKKLECELEESKTLKDLRQQWNESKDGKAPAIDYFKALAADRVKELKQNVLAKKIMANNFKAAAESYKERIAAIKYKIQAIAIEGGKNG